VAGLTVAVGVAAGSSAVGDTWRAASTGDLAEVERLVGQDPGLLDAGERTGQTPLMLASADLAQSSRENQPCGYDS
jgi:hypothetical protein